jgi:hypothetical protein
MFSYYGSKSKIINYYPPPKFDKIIEPFAGSARYSLKYFEKDVLLVDKYDLLINTWHYLQQASIGDILSLPDVKQGDDLSKMNISPEEHYLIYLCATAGGAGGTGNKICAEGTGFNSWTKDKKRIAKDLFKIKHWHIEQGDYRDIKNTAATWFIDPPYEFGGHKYKFSNKFIDYGALTDWILIREGQIIVCENTKATWMNFKPIKKMSGVKFTTTEAIWSNHKTNYDDIQQNLF